MPGPEGHRLQTGFVLLVCLLPFAAGGNPLDHVPHDTARSVAQALANREPITRPVPVEGLDRAYQLQDEVTTLLTNVYGHTIGYKAALTSSAAQRKFGIDHPLLGRLFASTIVRDGASLEEGFATRPLVEADLIARVANDAIHDAETDEELIAAIAGFHPTIELADLPFSPGVVIRAEEITAINAGTCKAVVGSSVRVGNTVSEISRLGNIRVILTGRDGRVLAEGNTSNLMGNPVHVIRWIRDTLKEKGVRLRRDDLLSLGSITTPRPAETGEEYQAAYVGLHPDHEVTIRVELRKQAAPAPTE